MKLNNKLLKINHSEILNKPITYVSWGNSITFDIPKGRHALLMCMNSGVILLWNPADRLNTAMLLGDASTFTITRASNNTTITVSKSGSGTWTAYVFI